MVANVSPETLEGGGVQSPSMSGIETVLATNLELKTHMGSAGRNSTWRLIESVLAANL